MKKRILSALLAVAVITSSVTIPAIAEAEKAAKTVGVENGKAALNAELYARYDSGVQSADGGSMEIVTYNEGTGYAYVVSGVKGAIVSFKLNETANTDSVAALTASEYDVKQLVSGTTAPEGFVYGDITSISVSPDGKKLAAAVQHADYDKAGVAAVFDLGENGELLNPVLITVGVQPDMITFAGDSTVLTANEGEPRMGYGEATVDPEGNVSIVNIADGSVKNAGFDKFKAEDLIAKNIILSKTDSGVIAPEYDLEPEYIAVSSDGATAYVSLQEANAVARLDIASGEFTYIESAGFEDYSKVEVDLLDNGKYEGATYENLVGARMPDGISLYEVNGKTYILTANEGDAREWGEYCNEKKDKSVTGKSIRVIDKNTVEGLPEGKTVMFGGRSFTVLEATDKGLYEVYDSGSDFERLTAKYFPDNFNCSNNDIDTDSRSQKKGPEPESVVTGKVGNKTYAFVALERIGGIMIYDITNPAKSEFVNYINSRDFSAEISGDVSPEGLYFVKNNGENRAALLAACEVSGTVAAYELYVKADGVKVLYTNDIHNAYEAKSGVIGYAAAANYKKRLEKEGWQVVMADAGDAIQGDLIGTLSKGSYIIDIMNKVGYDVAAPGNHEFDFGMQNFLELAKGSEFEYISCNFVDLTTENKDTVFAPYIIKEFGGVKVAFVGISTPDSYTKSTPAYFMDENGNYIYGFCEGDGGKTLYAKVQDTADDARKAGAELVIAVGHMGVDPTSMPYTSAEIIANTNGIDAFIDGHSHTVIKGDTVKNKDGKDVLLTSTGTKFANLGEMTIYSDGRIDSTLVSGLTVQDAETYEFVNGITERFAELKNKVVANSEVDLVVNDPESGKRLIRSQETNLGDLCADAYRAQLGADIAFVNGGGIRANIEKGEITYGDIIAVHPFGNAACMIEATGQQILDALEHGARAVGTSESGSFLHVSGLSYMVDITIPSSVVTDDMKMFIRVDGEYRVRNVMVGDEPLDLEKTYKLASHNYMLKSAGDGFSMFQGNKLLLDEVMIDNQALINYITEDLGGIIKADGEYADAYGQRRIKVVTDSKAATCTEDGYITYVRGMGTVTDVIPATGHKFVDSEVDATYFEKGYTLHTCEICGYSYKDNYKDKVALGKVTGFKAPVKTDNAITLTWDKNSEATGYIIQLYIDGKWTDIAKTDATEYTVADLTQSARYAFRIRAYKTEGDKTAYGEYTSKLVIHTVPANVTAFKGVAKTADSITLTWQKNKDATGYIIQQYIDGKWVRIAKIEKNTTTELNINNLKAGTRYAFRIQTYKTTKNGALKSLYTSKLIVYTRPAEMTGFKVTSKTTSTVTLSWNKNTTATGYIIQQYKDGKWVRIAKIANNKTTSYKVIGLKSGARNAFRIQGYKNIPGSAVRTDFTGKLVVYTNK